MAETEARAKLTLLQRTSAILIGAFGGAAGVAYLRNRARRAEEEEYRARFLEACNRGDGNEAMRIGLEYWNSRVP